MTKVTAMGQPNRHLYKSIVAGMSICLPAGIGLGIVYNQVPLGILAGNTAGILLGMAVSKMTRKKQE